MMLAVFVTVLVIVDTVQGKLSEKFCGDPSPAKCDLDPCFLVRGCQNYPQATCRDYKCGILCRPEFWFNGEEVTSLCEANLTAIADTSANGVSQSQQTGSNTGAVTNTNPADSAPPTAQDTSPTTGTSASSVPLSFGSSLMFNALLANADSLGLRTNPGPNDVSKTSSGTTAAVASTNTVGTTSAQSVSSSIFEVLQGNTRTAGASQGTESSCPNGVQKVTCTLKPCDVTTCPGLSAATCKNNFCGECKAEFWIGQTEVTSLCQQTSGQQSGQQSTGQAGSSSGPVLTNAFSGQALGATTRPGQNAITSNNNNQCPLYKMAVCNTSVCRGKSCANIRGAVCKVSNCGGCFPKFYFRGIDVTSRCQLQQQQQRRSPRRLPPWYYFMFGDMML
ncbi:uncharacterized protein LOC143275443 isoform X1 [Babylonia areolata]|uniref:uncharacterized protein LOC143275443 isoform X1 n=1 Tax=Babylonia areolata TaxID=304850 RepID=UPI003FCFDE4B